VIFGADRLDVNDLAIHRSKAIEQAAAIGNNGLDTGPMALAPLHLHIDNEETRRFRLQFDFFIGHRRILREVGFSTDYFMAARALSM
jgi:hypothetical protein